MEWTAGADWTVDGSIELETREEKKGKEKGK
jgi:hypothetical protein